jgi:hypothetical protein
VVIREAHACGQRPDSLIVGVGLPVVVTVKLLLWPRVRVAWSALVIAGAWVAGVMVMLTVAALVSRMPSFTRNVKLSPPVKPAVGVYTTVARSVFGDPVVQVWFVIAPSVP